MQRCSRATAARWASVVSLPPVLRSRPNGGAGRPADSRSLTLERSPVSLRMVRRRYWGRLRVSFLVLSLAGVVLFVLPNPALAHELNSTDFNWWDSGGYAACGKTGIGNPVAKGGRGRSWVTETADDCDAAKVSAYLQASTLLQDKIDGVWYWCGVWNVSQWQTTTVRVAEVTDDGLYDCPTGGEEWRTVSAHGACISGTCQYSGEPVAGPGTCPWESGAIPLPSGRVPTSCTPLSLYPTVSPAHGPTHP